MTDGKPYEMGCSCGTPICRKVIIGQDWVQEEVQFKYDGCFSWFIQRRLNALGELLSSHTLW